MGAPVSAPILLEVDYETSNARLTFRLVHRIGNGGNNRGGNLG